MFIISRKIGQMNHIDFSEIHHSQKNCCCQASSSTLNLLQKGSSCIKL